MSFCADDYLDRSPEALVLEGYRYWCTGVIEQEREYWFAAEQMYQQQLGSKAGSYAYGLLKIFTETLGLSATCPLRSSCVGCRNLCRDEVFVLGLISGIQHSEETTSVLCLDGLRCMHRQNIIHQTAEAYSTTLGILGYRLLPVPADTIKSIISNDTSNHLHH